MVFPPTVLSPGRTIQVVCESPVEAVKSEEVESALQTADLGEEAERTPEPAEETPRREERKASRPSLMALLRQMVSSASGSGQLRCPHQLLRPRAQGRWSARALGSMEGIPTKHQKSLSSC